LLESPKKKGKGSGSTQNVKKSERKRLNQQDDSTDSDEDEDCLCLRCLEPYSASKPGEKWIQCVSCKHWSHLKCGEDSPTYIWIHCTSDLEVSSTDNDENKPAALYRLSEKDPFHNCR